MELRNLQLYQFKNYQKLEIDFSKHLNCVIGKNGMGKTNLLDAIHYLSMTRSALSGADQHNIMLGQNSFSIHGKFFLRQGDITVACQYEKGKKKRFKVGGRELDKLSEHIGELPNITVLPDDVDIIREGSEARRKFFDSVMAQYDRQYLRDLIQVHQILRQRNAYLKQNEGKRAINRTLIATYDEKLLPLFRQIGQKRETFIRKFTPHFKNNHAQLLEGEEQPDVRYESKVLHSDFESRYAGALEKDILLQRTTMGIHRDDYIFSLEDQPIKKFGSQGQQKSFIIALKLSEFDFLKNHFGFSPLLLLDDIFDKLDDSRIQKLVHILSDRTRFAQIFITDARADRSGELFRDMETRFFHIENGSIL